MIGLLIITHEKLGEAYRGLTAHFFPQSSPDYIHILGVTPNEDQDDIINRSIAKLQEFPTNNGVLIITDIFGATPCNAARRLVRAKKSAILSGLNAPMMIKALQDAPRADNLKAFTETVKEAAIRGIIAITDDGPSCAPQSL